MKKDLEIAIVGGGIGGLTTALCLKKNGFLNVTVFEQESEFGEVGAAISLWPNALRVYKKIGVYSSIEPDWGEFKEVSIKTNNGKVLQTVRPKYDLPAVCIHRAHLHNNLRKSLLQEKLISDYKAVEIQEKNSRVEITFDNNQKKYCDVLIASDGINSLGRKKIIQDGTPVYRGYNIWRGITTLEDLPKGYGSETWGKGARIGIVPIKDGKFGWWAALNECKNTPDEPEGTLSKLKRVFGHWHSPIPELFDNTSKIIKSPAGDRKPIKKWYKGRIVLQGDAAHPTTPNLGQGACMAIEGAYLLAKCLDQFSDIETAFKTYEDLHFYRSKKIIMDSLQNGKMGQMENSAGILSRNTMVRLMPSSMALRMLDKYFAYDVTKINL